MKHKLYFLLLSFFYLFSLSSYVNAEEKEFLDEYKIKRENLFEFEQKPKITRAGDTFTIEFTTKGFCDVTIAIENQDGKIFRHLACGVLGVNAPMPFQKNSKIQRIIWDGKDDKGVYLDNKEQTMIRVSLGIKPQFERTLNWDPRKKTSRDAIDWPTFRATEEGVYVYDGGASLDHIRLFDHDGNYIRTIYPFSADKIEKVKGIHWKTLQPDGTKVPIRPGFQQTSFLTSGTNVQKPSYDFKLEEFLHPSQSKSVAHFGQDGKAASSFAVRNGKIALASIKLNRLSTDGTSGNFEMEGPVVSFNNEKGYADDKGVSAWIQHQVEGGRFNLNHLMPERIALSQDGKWVYLTRYAKTIFGAGSYTKSKWEHVVLRMPYAGNESPTIFAGEISKPGEENGLLNMPAGIDCDNEGRVYVADYYNNRIQVYSEEGKILQTVKVDQPAEIVIHKKTGELYVFCWPLCIPNKLGYDMSRIKGDAPRLVLEKHSAFPNIKKITQMNLPIARAGESGGNDLAFRAELDSWSTPTRIWLAPGSVNNEQVEIIITEEKEGKLEIIKNFSGEVLRNIGKNVAPLCYNQRLNVNPTNGKVYVMEGSIPSAGKVFSDLLEIDPISGKVTVVKLPINALDMCFDIDGNIYLRDYVGVVRYDPKNWRQIPFDYGEEMILNKENIIGALPLPTNMGWHQGGIWVSPKGQVVVGCLYMIDDKTALQKSKGQSIDIMGGKIYKPNFYPGRNTNYNWGSIYIHVWDKYGKIAFEDAIPGIGGTHGICMDDQDNLYVLAAGRRINTNKKYFNVASCTVLKIKPNKGKVISSGGGLIPLNNSDVPKRSPDMEKTFGNAWIDGVEWFYGGIGWDLKKGTGCSCWNARISLDLYARTFAPEIDRNSIAILDTNGNLITRIGKYGNVDDGKPILSEGGPINTKSIGGDEVSLMYGMFPAVHTDKRLFVSDAGNYRILSIKLGYVTEEKVEIK